MNSQEKKIAEYSLDMVSRRVEYGMSLEDYYDEIQAFSNGEYGEGEEQRIMLEAMEQKVESLYCGSCSVPRMYDAKKEEYYCPVCDS